MKTQEFEYKIGIQCLFTVNEVEALRKIAAVHYDAVCQRSAEPGGFLWGAKNVAEWEIKKGLPLSCHELDTCLKILEQKRFVKTTVDLDALEKSIREAMRKIEKKASELYEGEQGK